MALTDSCEGRQSQALAVVRAVPCLAQDLEALTTIFLLDDPPLCSIRSRSIATAAYGFGDASGSGLGSSCQVGHTLQASQGTWGRKKSLESSNYRELANLIRTLEEGLSSKALFHTEFFLFTDNSAAEAVYHNGTSSSKTLFALALRIRVFEMSGDFHFHLVHVSGRQMIAQGTDGLSRGCLSEGIMQDRSMLDFVPLHLSPLDRQPDLLHWIRDWTEQPTLSPLNPMDWYRQGQCLKHNYGSEPWHPEESDETCVGLGSCCS